MKQSKTEKLADDMIETAYKAACSGIPINVMDIPKVFAVGRKAVAQGQRGDALAATILNSVQLLRR